VTIYDLTGVPNIVDIGHRSMPSCSLTMLHSNRISGHEI